MKYVKLGRSGIEVSKLCFGTLTIGPLQKNLSLLEGSELLLEAVQKGINFFDTAQLYGTYPYLAQLIKKSQQPIIIASKSYAYDPLPMEKAIDEARLALNRDYIDIFLLHEQESHLTLKGHQGAWEKLLEAKNKGIVKAVGVSTHFVQCVVAATNLIGIDVIHPLINQQGLGIVDGTAAEMLLAIRNAKAQGIGIYSMKPLGGGNLGQHFEESLQYVLNLPELDAIALGMQSPLELEVNCMIAEGKKVSKDLVSKLKGLQAKRSIVIEPWCTGCGRCVERCSQGAMKLDDSGKATVIKSKCIRCSYCASVCKDFCIKVF